ncbi:DNA cytosine methyltransferase [Brevibacillus parabrevis]|uniref:DNA cytosine methyltransferase n=1 Tax=Brevibacillus parabrevis TaxID=54914 RepID=UPI001F622B04|nr:DNA cytosine methyltransferase [Brevibacillus parabrevis]
MERHLAHRQSHISREHNIRDVVMFSMMKPGSSSAQFMNKASLFYDKFLDELYPYDRTKHVDTYVRHSWNKPSNTILSHMEKDGLKFIHPDQPRTFTPYEAALIQSFPPDYVFSGGRNAQYRQIGNAVPPLLARSIGEAILELLENMDR